MNKFLFLKKLVTFFVLVIFISLCSAAKLFAETKTQVNPDGSKTITTSSGYEWTVDKNGKTVSGKRPGSENKGGDLKPYREKAEKEATESKKRFAEAQERAKKARQKAQQQVDEARRKAEEAKKVSKTSDETNLTKGMTIEREVADGKSVHQGQQLAKASVPSAKETLEEARQKTTEDRQRAEESSANSSNPNCQP